MNKFWLAACFCVAWAVTCCAQTALRPDQIGTATQDLTWALGGPGYQIGSIIPWRTDGSTNPSLLTADAAKVVELTNSAASLTLPLTTASGFGSGFGATLQTGAGTLTIIAGSGQTINGNSQIKLGAYQSVLLLSRGAQWYGLLSAPQPSAQAGASQLADNMTWVAGSAPPAAASWGTDHDASITITTTNTANDTATKAGGVGQFRSGRATAPSYTVGTAHKVIASFGIVAASDTGGSPGAGMLVGVNAATVPNTSPVAAVAPSWGVEGDLGGDWKDGTNNTTGTACGAHIGFVTGNTVWLAIDFLSGNVWCSLNCTTWFDAAPTSGSPVATLTAGTYFLAWSGSNFASVNDKVVLNAAPSLAGCSGLDGTWHSWNAG